MRAGSSVRADSSVRSDNPAEAGCSARIDSLVPASSFAHLDNSAQAANRLAAPRLVMLELAEAVEYQAIAADPSFDKVPKAAPVSFAETPAAKCWCFDPGYPYYSQFLSKIFLSLISLFAYGYQKLVSIHLKYIRKKLFININIL